VGGGRVEGGRGRERRRRGRRRRGRRRRGFAATAAATASSRVVVEDAAARGVSEGGSRRGQKGFLARRKRERERKRSTGDDRRRLRSRSCEGMPPSKLNRRTPKHLSSLPEFLCFPAFEWRF
jgi:hypothetical protein